MYSQSSFITLKNDKLLSSLTWQLLNPLLFNGPCLHQFEFILLDFCQIMLAVQKKKKSRRVREEFPISFLRMKWLTVTLFLNKQRKENVCFCWFFFFPFQKTFHLPLLSFGPSTESQKSICQRVPRKLQGTCNSNSNDSSIWQAHLAIKKKKQKH